MSDWSIGQEFGGSLKRTLSDNQRLNVYDGRLQIIDMTSGGKSIVLQKADMMPANKGAPLFIIVNSGSIDFTVRNYALASIEDIPAGMTGFVYLLENDDQAGEWVIRVGATRGGPFYTTTGTTTTVPVTTTTTPFIDPDVGGGGGGLTTTTKFAP